MDEFELTRRILSEPEDDPAAMERVRERLREAIEAERRGGRPPAWRRVLPVAAALGLVVVLVVAIIVPTGPGAAASELRRLGRIASAQKQLAPERGEFLLIRSEQLRPEGFTSVTGGSFDLITRLSISTWVAPDRSAFRREEVIYSTFATEADRHAWVEAERPDLTLPRTDTFPPGQAPIHDVAGLTGDPDRLLAALRSGAIAERPPGDDQVFILIGELLAQGHASPEIRGALFEVAARLDGVELVGEVEDPLRRPGLGISIPSASGRTQLVFDPDSAQLLAIELYETGAEGSERLASWTAARPTIVVEDAPRFDG